MRFLWSFYVSNGIEYVLFVGIVKKDLYFWAMLEWVQDFVHTIKNAHRMTNLALYYATQIVAWGTLFLWILLINLLSLEIWNLVAVSHH